MNINALKTTGLSFALAAAFLVAAGAASGSSAFAQDWRWRDRDRDGWQDNRWERFAERRGYREGMMRGREDACEGRRFNPFSAERFRFGDSEYREGFRFGYAQGYRQNANNSGYRDNGWYGRDGYYNRDGYRNDQYRQNGYYDRWGNFHRY